MDSNGGNEGDFRLAAMAARWISISSAGRIDVGAAVPSNVWTQEQQAARNMIRVRDIIDKGPIFYYDDERVCWSKDVWFYVVDVIIWSKNNVILMVWCDLWRGNRWSDLLWFSRWDAALGNPALFFKIYTPMLSYGKYHYDNTMIRSDIVNER